MKNANAQKLNCVIKKIYKLLTAAQAIELFIPQFKNLPCNFLKRTTFHFERQQSKILHHKHALVYIYLGYLEWKPLNIT